MSKKTYVEAIEYVLDTELEARDDIICFRPGARRAFEEAERDVPLPRIGKKAFSVALGAALCGVHSVLDLRQESGAAALLKEAMDDLPFGMAPVMTIIVCAEDKELIMELPGVYVMQPRTPRQAAGFLRSALKMNRLSVIIADQALFAEEDDIPEDRSFALLPLETAEETDEPAAAEKEAVCAEEDEPAPAGGEAVDEDAAPDEAEPACGMEQSEEDAYDETEAEPARSIAMSEEEAYDEAERTPARVFYADVFDPECDGADERREEAWMKSSIFCASRQTKCDLTALHALCELLEMDDETLVERCAGHVLPLYGGFELHYEADAPEGEAAFLPPVEENASIWLGSNMLTVSYDAAQMRHADAAQLLRAVKRVLEKPQLLIYDKEYDKA